MSGLAVYSIGHASSCTGLSNHTLRAWERRYRAIVPQRSPSGRRLYRQSDIDRLLLFKRAISRGHRISAISGLSDAELAALVSNAEMKVATSADDLPRVPQTVLDGCLEAVRALDGALLDHQLRLGRIAFSRQAMIEEILQPFMQEVGKRWYTGQFRIVHGQLAAELVHLHLHGMLSQQDADASNKPLLLIGTLAGQRCYLGALAVGVLVRDLGWKTSFLGFDLPAEEFSAAYLCLNPHIIAVSLTCRVSDAFLQHQLRCLTDNVGNRCPVVVGGQASGDHAVTIRGCGTAYCRTVTEMLAHV